MRKLFTLLAAICLMVVFNHEAIAQRYLTEIFSGVTVTQDVQYASNIDVLTGAPMLKDLKMDVYEPAGDWKDDRPVVLFFPTGNFLPAVINGGPYGSIRDSVNVEVCKRLAKRGYVALSVQNRLGWNPVSADQNVRTGTILNAAYRGIQDARACVRYLRKSVAVDGNPHGINPDQIIMGGVGTGGYVSLGSAFLTDFDDVLLTKFINFDSVPPEPYVDTLLSGNIYGTNMTPLNIPNNPSYSSDFALAFNLGGASGDTSWVKSGNVPLVAFHVVQDPNAPYNTGDVIVPTTGDVVISDAAGSYALSRLNYNFGNNDAFALAGISDAYTTVADSRNDGYEGLFPFFAPTPVAPVQCVTSIPGFPMTPGSYWGGPWNWYSEAWFIAAWNSVPGQSVTGAERNCMTRQGDHNNPVIARAYIDTVMGYLNPRIVVALGLDTTSTMTAVDPQVLAGLKLYPNPADEAFTIFSEHIAPVQAVELLDVNGRLIRTLAGFTSRTIRVDRDGLAPGMYFARIRFQEGSVTRKIVFR
jgi:hypothetical protein